PAAAFLLPEQPRRNHPGVVEHQQVAGLQQLRQVTHLQVGERALARWHHQQPAGGTLGQRLLRDQFLRQVVVEVGLLQGVGGMRGAPIVRAPGGGPAAQRSNLVDRMIEDEVRSTPSTAPMRSVSSSIAPTSAATPRATRSCAPLTECSERTSGISASALTTAAMRLGETVIRMWA